MSSSAKFASVWDALEDDPIRAENFKLRSALMIKIVEQLNSLGLTQQQAATMLHTNQPRICALLNGKIERFRLDSLVDMANRLGLSVSIRVAA